MKRTQDEAPSETKQKTNVSDGVDTILMAPREEESPGTESRRLAITTEIVERELAGKGIARKTSSDPDLAVNLQLNPFSGRVNRERIMGRTTSLPDLVGGVDVDEWNSGSSFGQLDPSHENSTNEDKEGGEMIATAQEARGEINENAPELVPVMNLLEIATPTRNKRRLSPHNLTPIGKPSKMSTEVEMSPILRMNFEYWTEEGDENQPQAPETDSAPPRSILTPRRRLGSDVEGIFQRMMNQRDDIISPSRHRTRSLSMSTKISKTPGNQKKISEFIRPLEKKEREKDE